jgi:hypothetical protein
MTKKQMTKQAMIQVLLSEELRSWNTLMFDIWYYGDDSKEVAGSRSAWSVLSTTLFQLHIQPIQGPERRNMIMTPKLA